MQDVKFFNQSVTCSYCLMANVVFNSEIEISILLISSRKPINNDQTGAV